MKKFYFFAATVLILILSVSTTPAEQKEWEKGGPKYLYVKPTKKPPHHGIYDEGMKCLDCHKYDGVDAYTSATMTIKKTKKLRCVACFDKIGLKMATNRSDWRKNIELVIKSIY